MTAVAICAFIMAIYQCALTLLLLFILDEERRMLYRFLSGSAPVGREEGKKMPVSDRIKELRKQWRTPRLPKGKGDEQRE